MKRNIALDPMHPKHLGIKMQAHHLLSEKGIKHSRLGTKIVQFGYEIDDLENLAFLPCTLQGACHLGVQPHRGDHATASARAPERGFSNRVEVVDEDDYNDDKHPESYHEMVSSELKTLLARLEKKCSGKPKTSSDFVNALHDLSQSILMTIYGHPNEARLTSIADHFTLGNHVGCGGVDDVRLHGVDSPCPTGRDHFGKQGPGQIPESIRFPAGKRYIPRPKK